jgi:hypothetical protein
VSFVGCESVSRRVSTRHARVRALRAVAARWAGSEKNERAVNERE